MNKNNLSKLSETAKKMPEVFQFVLERMNNNEQTYNVLKTLLQRVISKMTQAGIGQQTYCNYLHTHKNIDVNILKIFGISDKQLRNGFEEIGYDKNINLMYVDMTYQTLSLCYWIGLEKEDQDIRFFAISLIAARLFNGRIFKYYPNGSNGCNEEIANYVLNSKDTNNNVLFKKYRSPVLLILNYFAPTMDAKYAKEILNDPTNKKRGLKILMNQLYSRINSAFKITANYYYKAYEEGNKETIKSNNHTFEDGSVVERFEGFNNKIDKISDKVVKALAYKAKPLHPKNKQILKTKFGISDKVINDLVNFFHSDDDIDLIKEYFEVLLKASKFSEEEQICNTHILYHTNEIVSQKGKDKNILLLKEKTDGFIKNIFNKINFDPTKHRTQIIKLRKVFIALAILKLKEQLCTKNKDHFLE